MSSLLDNPSKVTLPFPQSLSEQLPPSPFSPQTAMKRLEPLMRYVCKRRYEGWDLFDGLNSNLFLHTPLYRSELFRLMLIQFCKRSPVNLRALLMVPKGFNAKGGALFLMGNLNLLRNTGDETYVNEAYVLFHRLRHAAIEREHGVGWGYNFDWQARAFYVPQGTPNLVTTVYVGRALLEYYRHFHDIKALELALSAADFIAHEMVKFEDTKYLCFNYIPGRDAEVHNANLLGASYLAETLQYRPADAQESLREKVLKSVRFSVADIHSDGAWPYGTKPFHRWVDNFHTAFNIECLIRIGEHLQTDEFYPLLVMVTNYYLRHLFTEEGLPKYYNRQLYPIDVHVIAEAIVLIQILRERRLPIDYARLPVIERALLELSDRFQDKQGFFYYQQTSKGWNKIPYIRWGQAWMFYALSLCLK